MTWGLTALALVAGVAGATMALLTARSPKATAGTVLVRVGLVLSVFALLGGAAVVFVVPLDAFAVIHLLYLLAVVSLPIVGLGVGVVALRWSTGGSAGRTVLGVVAVALLLLAPLGIWSTHVAPYRLREDRVTLALGPDRSLEQPLRIGVLSDLQNNGVTGYEAGAVDRLMAEEPDVILIAGDLFQGNQGEFEATLPAYRRILGRLHAPGGVFVVRGDVDGDAFDPLIEGTDLVVLDDEVTSTEVRGQRLVIGGVELAYDAAAAEPVYQQLDAVSGPDPVILLAHRPDAVLQLPPDSRVDLTVAGHTHGGQIALPFFGPLITLTEVSRPIAAGGLHAVDGNAIYVSSGVGIERGRAPQIRFLTRPSFGIVTLTAAGS